MTTPKLAAPRPLEWLGVSAFALLALIQLGAAAGRDPLADPATLLPVALGITGLLASIRFAAAACFESRVGMTLVAAATVLGIVFAHTIGLPGASPESWTARDGILSVLAVASTAAIWRNAARSLRPSARPRWGAGGTPVARP